METIEGITYSRVDRSDLSADIERLWLGRKTSPYGMQYLDLKDGILQSRGLGYERTDVLIVQGFNCNVFVHVDGSVQLDEYQNKPTAAEKELMLAAAKVAFERETQFIDKQARFFNDKPWEAAHGLPVAEGLAAMHALGW